MKPELRCHAVLCSSETKARLMQKLLTEKLHQAFVEFRKEKQQRQNARLSVVSVLYPSTPARKVVLASGGANYRPPLERSKSAPRLSSIEEDRDGEESEAREEERRRAAAGPPAMPPRPRALSEPLVPPPSVCSHPQAGAGSGADSDTESDTGSERSGASVPSDPTADSDCEQTEDGVLLQSTGPCRVYHVRRGSPVERRLSDVRLQVRCRLDDEAIRQWTRTQDELDDSASDESGYAEEVTRPA